MTDKAQTTIPAYWTRHWEKDMRPSGSWSLGDKPPKMETDGFVDVFHPEQILDVTLLPRVLERSKDGFVRQIKEVDLSKYIPRGSRLTWRQRWTGIA